MAAFCRRDLRTLNQSSHEKNRSYNVIGAVWAFPSFTRLPELTRHGRYFSSVVGLHEELNSALRKIIWNNESNSNSNTPQGNSKTRKKINYDQS